VNGHQSHSEAQPCFIDALTALGLGPANWAHAGVSVFTAILPSTDGYVSRADFLRLRLQDFPFPISKVQECVAPLRKYTACRLPPSSVNSEDSLASVIEQAAGVIQWADLEASVSILDLQHYLLDLTHELRDRLDNAPWLTSRPIARKRVALIRGRPNLTAGGSVYRAARALGLDLVIIDDEGHWLQPDTDDNRMHREAFLATDMTEDSGVADRIIASITRYPLPIHGVFTLSDNFFVTCARVASALNLSTNPISAFETSVDKYRSRLLQDAPGQTARVSSVDELNTLLSTANPQNAALFTPTYPLIVKPTKGWSSECVSKVTSPSDLALAVQKATARHGSAAVIEPFFAGPEIDVNFVLLDGEVLFCEIADEPPCQADAATAGVEATFSPEALTLPSALPAEEQATVREAMREVLVKAGFRTGVFHVEARVVNSACEYQEVGEEEGGVVDFVPKGAERGAAEKAVCKLIEINARPPGYRVSVPSRHTYGVDFFAAHMLAAVGDHERLRLAARPFDHAAEGRTTGAQYWSRLVYVPAPKEGVVRWSSGLSPCEELKRRRPDLGGKIVVAVDYCVPGERVGLYTDGARTYVAHLMVCSRVSRRDAIALGDEVLREFALDIEGDGWEEKGVQDFKA
jgi:biotin carboxylase